MADSPASAPATPPSPFCHLHIRSHFSLLGSTIAIPKLVDALKSQGADAAALTDRGNLCGAFEWWSLCKDKGMSALIGCELAVAPLGIAEKTRDSHQVVLIAASQTGYRNLAKLVSRAWSEGFYFEPRVDIELMAAHAGDVVCLTGAGPQGILNRHLVSGAVEEASRELERLKSIYSDRLFVEIADTGDDGPLAPRRQLPLLADRSGVPVVATNWVHYLKPDDAPIHDVLLAIEGATALDDPRVQRKRLGAAEYWLKPPATMIERFSDLPEAIANTRRIADLCKGVALAQKDVYYLPRFPCPEGFDESSLLRQKTAAGLLRRYGDAPSTAVLERCEFELATIIRMGFPAYFLIVADFIGWAKSNGIPVGPGRGSAAGSLVSYCLGITDMDPLAYGLLFERFLNPGRKSMPDIDVDFCQDGRDRVLKYVADKYGHEAVTQIMTLGTMKARSAIKDVARAYAWTPEESQELANLVPNNPAKPVDLAMALGRKAVDKEGKEWATVDGLVKRYESDPRTKQVVDAAVQVEKLGRSLGVHACGVIIAPGPVSGYVPVCNVKGKPATMFNMTQVEKAGLLKMDFLGLKTMSILKKAVDLAREVDGADLALERIPLKDRKTFEMLGRGQSLGVFQCESRGFQELLRTMKPDRFEDMIALVALYRPGPLMANMHVDYCERKSGRQKVDYPHPVLEGVLKETYGLYIYQEQVMSISRELCGFTPAEADDLRKAMGKKDIAILEKLKEKFIEGAFTKHGFDRDKCGEMWRKILGFASYCFNKSHSACYGLIAYWTAYLKANHYPAFMTANLIFEMGNKDKMTLFVEELRGHGIPVLPPDVNESSWEFSIAKKESVKIRFGFGGVKGIGEAAAAHLIERRSDRPFASLYDLCERVDLRVINKRVVEALIQVGALDSLHPNRQALHATMERAFDRGSRLTKMKSSQQQTLFGDFEADATFKQETQGYVAVDDWTPDQRLAFEKSLTGYWISGHPVQVHAGETSRFATATAAELPRIASGQTVSVAAVVVAKRIIKTKSGGQMAVVQLEDPAGRFEAVLFGGRGRRGQEPPFDRFHSLCEPDQVCLFTGTVERRERRNRPPPPAAEEDASETPPVDVEDGESEPAAAVSLEETVEVMPSLIVSDVIPAAAVAEKLTSEVVVAVAEPADPGFAQRLSTTGAVLAEHRGDVPLTMQVHVPGDVLLTLAVGSGHRLRPSPAALSALRQVWGTDRVRTLAKAAAGTAPVVPPDESDEG
ncbi:DNA-directed DNA polymerase [Planctomycetota bacterium]|nr:DNA-directed DNA polymerase [Planctomycetota bacterium]